MRKWSNYLSVFLFVALTSCTTHMQRSQYREAPSPNIPGVQTITLGDYVAFIIPADDVFYNHSPRIQNTQPLAAVAAYLRCIYKVTVAVEVHTDNLDSYQRNVALSTTRARNIVDYLSWQGIDARIITGEGFAGSHPIASNATASGRAQNRRIEIHTWVLNNYA